MDEPRIKVYGSDTEITIAANAAGLHELADRLRGLADPELRDGYHEHLEGGIDLQEGSISLILERDDKVQTNPE
ncbi:hypothetical protein GA0115240_123615 [Streptomyces sp. DvalAA-14]|uniref:Imm32 family immunity protein n=1 Tax=unclassified Streptomyces TaxID=2593676 RepID=UPI00081B4845|nr:MULTISPECIES: hypothetical protein [unclassified Streptomyces]MYS20809.1 hypothetical protein [Streptomyces sp. SID4948]SCD77739.1 hypothetical protein GA0115240_123615 [Streptomyces sp. DvalAA-14]